MGKMGILSLIHRELPLDPGWNNVKTPGPFGSLTVLVQGRPWTPYHSLGSQKTQALESTLPGLLGDPGPGLTIPWVPRGPWTCPETSELL